MNDRDPALPVSQALADLRQHVGNRHSAGDVITASQVARLAVTLDVEHPAPQAGDLLPPGWHAAFFPPLAPRSRLRPDGQPTGGGVAPTVPLPRRLLAGIRSVYHEALRVGDVATRLTEVADISVVGTTDAPSVRMMLRESISTDRGPAVVDERVVLFYGEAGPGDADSEPTIPASASWKRTHEADPVTIFRMSAVRFNAHRIHYDRDYVTGQEGYPGLVVPVSLVSLQLLELCRVKMPDQPLAGFEYRSHRPMFDTAPYSVSGTPDDEGVSLWANDHEGSVTMTARASFRPGT